MVLAHPSPIRTATAIVYSNINILPATAVALLIAAEAYNYKALLRNDEYKGLYNERLRQ